jgi:hypothetical protein
MRSMSVHSAALCETRIIIPVRNGGERWREAAAALCGALSDPSMVAVVDSSSTDGSDQVAAGLAFEVERIDPRTYNHGRTRQEAVDRFCHGKEFALRYFDFGVLHAQLPQLLRELGEPEGTGLRFVESELRYMTAAAPWRLPEVVARDTAKYPGYRLGRIFKKLPNFLRRRLSMTAGYWDSTSIDGRA